MLSNRFGSSMNNFNAEWRPALVTVNKLLNRENVKKPEWHDLFVTNNRITSWVENGSALLLKALEEQIKEHVVKAAARIHANLADNDLLRSYVAEWNNFSILIEYLPTPFAFIERGAPRTHTGVSRSDGRGIETLTAIRNIMFSLWNGHVFETIQVRLLDAAMELVRRERLGEGIESSLVIGVRESFVNYGNGRELPLAMYQNHFERRYVDSAKDFYSPRSQQFLAENGILNYMGYAYEKINEEEERGRRYLDFTNPDSFRHLVKEIVNVLVVEYKDQLLAEASNLIANQECTRLQMLFHLMDRTVDGVPPLLNNLSKHIKTEGLTTIQNNAETIVQDCEKYVDQLLSMYTRFSSLVLDAFCNDARFLTVRDQAFQEVVNNTDVFRYEISNPKLKGHVDVCCCKFNCYNFRKNNQPPESKCPELLANYCDLLLRKSTLTKKLTSDQIDEKLSNVLLVLKYVSNKDVFMRYHKTHLSRRLILEMSADQEKEEVIVNKFREHGMPSDFVSKLYRMLQDMELNRELSAEFRRYAAEHEHRNIADVINLKILNAGAWSRGRDKCHVSFPSEIEELIPMVDDFYKVKHTGRKLNWAHNWSSSIVTFVSNRGKYDLELSAFQMAILFCYNDLPQFEKRSLESLRVATELPDADLIRTLLSLVINPKTKIQVMLTDCDPINPKQFNEQTKFWINHDFAIIKNGDKVQSRGKLTLINRIIMNQESIEDEAHNEIMRLREFRIQEGVVKLMKTRRTMKQNVLHNELVALLRHMFTPTRRLIKQQLDWLIEQNFIRRDSEDMETFIYVA
ncbi:Cullin-5 [Aphelenchoides besseyi]|nr:Cullin-5 [Aphelenchoides besseyi]KAI6200064.1 Cullin-5 [Aphelenchoides besseyi]